MGRCKPCQSSLRRGVAISGISLMPIAEFSRALKPRPRSNQVARLPKARMPATGTMKPIVTAAMVSAARSA